jgi:hypothetical protein
MAFSQQFLVCDSSTLANFKQWAQAISAFFTTAGWTQSSDTGQVNWSTISSVPGSSAYVYEVWQPNDGLTTFYVKIQYGNAGTAAQPNILLTLSTATNGAGTPTGFFTTTISVAPAGLTVPSTTTQFECDFSGAAGRIGAMMWRNSTTTNSQQLFIIERSVNSSGAYTSSHVTLATIGNNGGSNEAFQQSLVFGVGPAPASFNSNRGATNYGGFITRGYGGWSNGSTWITSAFNGGIGLDTISPYVGFFDNQLTMLGTAGNIDLAEGVTFTVTLYGATRTYVPSKAGRLGAECGPMQTQAFLCMRFD